MAAFFSLPANPPLRVSFYPPGYTRRRYHHPTASQVSFRACQPRCEHKLVRSSSTPTEVVSLSPISYNNTGEVSFAGHDEAARVWRQNLPLLAREFNGLTQIRLIGLGSAGTTQTKTTKDSLVYVGLGGIAVKDTVARATGVVPLGRHLVANTAIIKAETVAKTVLVKKFVEWAASIPQASDLCPMHLFAAKFFAALVMDQIDVLKKEGYSYCSETHVFTNHNLRPLVNIHADAPINEDPISNEDPIRSLVFDPLLLAAVLN